MYQWWSKFINPTKEESEEEERCTNVYMGERKSLNRIKEMNCSMEEELVRKKQKC